jgi:hypothetical protein
MNIQVNRPVEEVIVQIDEQSKVTVGRDGELLVIAIEGIGERGCRSTIRIANVPPSFATNLACEVLRVQRLTEGITKDARQCAE